ncbi:MAG: DUF3293 domain-containing protein [Azoarcus sp.]|nr:DUF3293 domain-containing protein [Azoarcus sp.]
MKRTSTWVTPEVVTAYCATTYRVYLPLGMADIRVGQKTPRVDDWLRAEGLICWGLVTAWNPGSQRCSAVENLRAQDELRRLLLAQNHRFFPGENRADAGDWPVEPSFFIPALALRAAHELARRFGQNAFLWARTNTAARLVFVHKSPTQTVLYSR